MRSVAPVGRRGARGCELGRIALTSAPSNEKETGLESGTAPLTTLPLDDGSLHRGNAADKLADVIRRAAQKEFASAEGMRPCFACCSGCGSRPRSRSLF
jgi:hypothetical protein